MRALRDWKDAVVASRIIGRAGELARRMRCGHAFIAQLDGGG